ncbi:hypothetical protein C8R44DRAFT_928186 [Mycena epipterygia]|nr:hypothetical protein C8R44DRAFT_928186 [Mycena epipterygia]
MPAAQWPRIRYVSQRVGLLVFQQNPVRRRVLPRPLGARTRGERPWWWWRTRARIREREHESATQYTKPFTTTPHPLQFGLGIEVHAGHMPLHAVAVISRESVYPPLLTHISANESAWHCIIHTYRARSCKALRSLVRYVHERPGPLFYRLYALYASADEMSSPASGDASAHHVVATQSNILSLRVNQRQRRFIQVPASARTRNGINRNLQPNELSTWIESRDLEDSKEFGVVLNYLSIEIVSNRFGQT